MRTFIRGIRNLIYWFKVIWNDRDWDYYFILVLLKHKLKRMERLFIEESYGANSDRLARDMHVTSLVLDRAINRDYFFNKEAQRLLHIDIRKASDYVNYMEKQDIDYLSMMIRKHITDWWD